MNFHDALRTWTVTLGLGALIACGGPEGLEPGGMNPNRDPSGDLGQPGPNEPDPDPFDEGEEPIDEMDNPIDEAEDPDPNEEDPVEDDDGVDPLRVAPFDNDSLQNPGVSELLRITGRRELGYLDQISALQGDAEDFVEFQLPNSSNPAQPIQVELLCTYDGPAGNVQGRVTFHEDGVIDPGQMVLCNEGLVNLTVDNTKVHTAMVHFGIPPQEQTLLDYELVIIGFR